MGKEEGEEAQWLLRPPPPCVLREKSLRLLGDGQHFRRTAAARIGCVGGNGPLRPGARPPIRLFGQFGVGRGA